MKNKSELMFLLKVIIFMLVIILFILVYFLYKTINTSSVKEKENIIQKRNIVKKYNIDNVELIDIEFKNYEVTYKRTNKEKLIIKQSGKANRICVEKKKEKNKLVLKETVSNILEKKKFIVYIPNSYMGKIVITNGFNNIKIDDFNEIKLDNNAGNVTFYNVDIIDLKNVSGNVSIGGELNQIKGSSSTGNITINRIYGKSDIETITGDIIINNFYIEDESYIETTAGNIEINVDKKSNCRFKYNSKSEYKITKDKCKNGKNDLNLKNVTGNIIIK